MRRLLVLTLVFVLSAGGTKIALGQWVLWHYCISAQRICTDPFNGPCVFVNEIPKCESNPLYDCKMVLFFCHGTDVNTGLYCEGQGVGCAATRNTLYP